MSGNTCTKCNSPAYLSLLGSIECSNKKCEYYSADLYPDKVEASPPKKTLQDEDIITSDQAVVDDDNTNTPQYLWSHYHTDIGW